MPWINEFHYDNTSTDVGEFVEIAAAAGTDLTGWTIVLYNGSGGAPYDTRSLSGVVPNQQNGFGTIVLNYPNTSSGTIQNGAPDGIALVDAGGNVVEFISYEGSFTAVGGPANGTLSTNVGVSETGSANGTSIGRVGTGDEASDFTWALITDDTPGARNVGQTFQGAASTVSVDDISVTEGDSGQLIATFTVTRTGGSGAFSVDYATADGAATAGGDYDAESGTLNFGVGENSQTVS